MNYLSWLTSCQLSPAIHHSLTLNTPQRIERKLIANRTSAPQSTDQANKRVLSYAYFRLREIR